MSTQQVFDDTKHLLATLCGKVVDSEKPEMSDLERRVYDLAKKNVAEVENEFTQLKTKMVYPLSILEADNFEEYDDRIGAYTKQFGDAVLEDPQSHLAEIEAMKSLIQNAVLTSDDAFFEELSEEFISKTKRYTEHKRARSILEFDDSVKRCRTMNLAHREFEMRKDNLLTQQSKLMEEWTKPF